MEKKKIIAVTVILLAVAIGLLATKHGTIAVIFLVAAIYWKTVADAVHFFKNYGSMSPKEIREHFVLYGGVIASSVGIILIPFGHLNFGVILTGLGALVPTVYIIVTERKNN